MRKLYLSVLLLISMFLLVGCDSKKELEVTYQEANEMLESVNVEALADDVFNVNGKVELKLVIENLMEVNGKVSFDFAASLKSLEEFYIIGTVKGDLTQQVAIPGMSQNTESKINAKIYIIDNNLYVDGTLTEGDTETELKFKQLNVFDETTLQELRDTLSQQGQAATPNEPILTEGMNFKLYKVNNGHLLEMSMTLEDILRVASAQDPEIPQEIPAGLTETGVNKFVTEITFDDVIKKVDLTYEVNFSYDASEEMGELGGFVFSVNSKGELHVVTKGKAPKMPDMDVLNAYPEMEENPLIPSFF